MIINQTEYGPLHIQGWVTLGEYEYQDGITAVVGHWPMMIPIPMKQMRYNGYWWKKYNIK